MLLSRDYIEKIRQRVVALGGIDPGGEFKMGYPSLAEGVTLDEAIDDLAKAIIAMQTGDYEEVEIDD